jgi:hypothetical protein
VAAVLTLVGTKQVRINIHKPNSTITQYIKYKNTVNTITYYQNTHTYRHPHITKLVKTTTVQDTHQMK